VLNCPLGLCSWEMLFIAIKCVELPPMVVLFMAMFFIRVNVSNLHLRVVFVVEMFFFMTNMLDYFGK
jgi:hypothetical protein